ncbi:type II toxin-antitoxin system MqsR family toxin [Salinisphaera orenii]|uniref:type II toxin-antitoxin system MqsR family toxin n=1 Tax=Salinisphaera orenii TaxID=856731 RepID=UPI000DBE2150
MVSNDEQRREYPSYSLDEVQRLAARGRVNFATRKVDCDVQDLDYTLDEVCRCLTALNPGHFKESILYPDTAKWVDVYRINHDGPSQDSDRLYIKLRIGRNAISVQLFSFHLEGRF